jgi:hypothetical protein
LPTDNERERERIRDCCSRESGYEGGTTAHSLFGYPVVEEEDIDDIHPMDCRFSPDRSEFLREVSVIFWDEIVSND